MAQFLTGHLSGWVPSPAHKIPLAHFAQETDGLTPSKKSDVITVWPDLS